MSWKIEHPCPQCGAPVELEEADRIFKCQFCRTRLLISPRETFQFFLPPGKPSPDLFFLPYWRFKGMAFSCDQLQVAGKIIDSNILAVKLPQAPPSLGLRPQVLKLRYAAPEAPGRFLKPELPFRTTAACGPCSRAEGPTEDLFIGEIKSLIYSPVVVKGDWIFDAILDRPVCPAHDADWKESKADAFMRIEDQISFLATLCPQCGFDLEGEKESLVLLCRNCGTSWRVRDRTFESVPFDFFAPPGGGGADIHLPFWIISTDVSGLPMRSYADLVRLANLPQAVQSAWEKEAPHFAAPAFKVHPSLFLRLARTMTFLQKRPERNAQPPKTDLYPVTLPLNEALESLRVLIASIAHPKKSVLPHLHEMTFSLKDSRLAYLPFTVRGEELIQQEIGMSVQKAALSWGKLI